MARFARKHLIKDELSSVVDEEDDSTEDEQTTFKQTRPSFNLLLESDNDVQDEGEEEEKQTKPEVHQDGDATQQPIKAKKKKKKKKEDKRTIQLMEGEDEIDASLREVNDLMGDCPPAVVNRAVAIGDGDKSILSMAKKNFNPDVELRRIFGSSIVQENVPNRNRRRVVRKQTTLAQYKDSWPAMQKSGLTMDLVSKEGNIFYFNVKHKKDYQEAQKSFWNAVDTMDPQSIADNHRRFPYHIDTLLQLSDICKMNNDMEMCTDLVERALYAFEYAFHPLFKVTLGTCRLDYHRPENRAFFITLFRQLVFLGNKFCCRTSLELCKLLFSLDPETDPLCVLLLIDFYSLRSKQYHFLIQLHHELEVEKSLSSLPNFAFSVPLAMFLICQKDKEMSSGPADEMLQNSLLQYPGLLMPLLDKCNVEADKVVTSHSFFGTAMQLRQSQPLKQLIELYTCRNYPCWKEAGVLSWLEQNVKEVLGRVDSGDPLVALYKHRNESSYKKTPRNVLRHLVICDVQGISLQLPADVAGQSFMNYDPLPPLDSIESYSRPVRQTRVQQSSGILAGFLQSMLPGYNPEEVVDGAVGEGAEMRIRAQSLMEAMRELLNNMQEIPDQPEDGAEHLPHEEWD